MSLAVIEVLFKRLLGFHSNELPTTPGWSREAFTGEEILARDLECGQKLNTQLNGSVGFLSRRKDGP